MDTEEKVTYTEERYPSLSLRFITRDGQRILQQRHTVSRRYSNGVVEDGVEWLDVPCYEKAESND